MKVCIQSMTLAFFPTLTFVDIGGLEDIIEELKESVLYPLTCPQLYNYHASLLQAPKGVLFYGPPGCGKTMLAKAIAAESSAIFINIRMSTIMDKWFGESNKLVAAIFRWQESCSHVSFSSTKSIRFARTQKFGSRGDCEFEDRVYDHVGRVDFGWPDHGSWSYKQTKRY